MARHPADRSNARCGRLDQKSPVDHLAWARCMHLRQDTTRAAICPERGIQRTIASIGTQGALDWCAAWWPFRDGDAGVLGDFQKKTVAVFREQPQGRWVFDTERQNTALPKVHIAQAGRRQTRYGVPIVYICAAINGLIGIDMAILRDFAIPVSQIARAGRFYAHDKVASDKVNTIVAPDQARGKTRCAKKVGAI